MFKVIFFISSPFFYKDRDWLTEIGFHIVEIKMKKEKEKILNRDEDYVTKEFCKY